MVFTTGVFKIGEGICQGCLLSLCLFNLYAEYTMQNAGLDESQVGIKTAGRNINNLRYADDTTITECEEGRNIASRSERGEWKSWLETQHSENKDHGIQSHHFRADQWGKM